ncbi:protein kinase [Lentisphaera profundi]|uniref:Protein kinase n=1 Tax=Lentisphaera profundi TaxID=1658616 RepID=A0ABY7VXQ2_9BACT|nr:serine/threonine-protein kinase [Lentisphaera profundi]WDE98897.1 protein kinase [Lentisphaera profundi]
MAKEGDYFDEKLADFFDDLDDLDNLPLLDTIASITDRYCDFQYLDEGGIKIIHRCRDLKTGREVAMASLKECAKDPQKELFFKEARLTAALQHPNIIPLHDLGLKGEQAWFTMKLISGASLEQVLQDLKDGRSQQLNTLSERLDVFIKVCDAMAYAHSRGVLHLDIKPDNIQISNYGDVLLCDWGLAKVMASVCDEELLECYTFNPKELDLTIDGLVKGTPGYMAPEQTRLVKAKKGIATDTFSLGCVLYKILTLEKPFKGADLMAIMNNTVNGRFPKPSVLNPDIPLSLEAVCLKALAPDPQDRYASVIDLQKEILDYRQGFATNAENATLLKLTRLWYNRHRTLSIAGIIILLISFSTAFFAINSLKLEKINALQMAEKLQLEKLNALESSARLKLEADKLQLENEFHKKFNKGAAPRFLQRAQIAFESYNFDDAVNFCDSAVELDPSLSDAWALKGLLHIIHEQFGAALNALNKCKKKNALKQLAKDFYQIKNDDSQRLSLSHYLKLFQRSLTTGQVKLSGGLIHHKAYSEMPLDQRIEFCKGMIEIHNEKSLRRFRGGKTINFSYDPKIKKLDLSGNPWMQSALIVQNFPAYAADFSYTGIKNFICFRKQPLRSLNVSGTPIIELHTLENHNLIALNISHTSIGNLRKLKDFTLLKTLNISHSAVRSSAILKDLNGLETLTIHQGQLTESDLKRLNPATKVLIHKN